MFQCFFIDKSAACRQWDEEEKTRQLHTEPVAAHNGHEDGDDDDDNDAASTKGGVLHEEDFHETKALAGQSDVEAPSGGTGKEDEGLLAVLKIVDWWKVLTLCSYPHISMVTRHDVAMHHLVWTVCGELKLALPACSCACVWHNKHAHVYANITASP